MPLLPSPVTTTRPWQARMRSTARVKSPFKREDRPSTALPSTSITRRASATISTRAAPDAPPPAFLAAPAAALRLVTATACPYQGGPGNEKCRIPEVDRRGTTALSRHPMKLFIDSADV